MISSYKWETAIDPPPPEPDSKDEDEAEEIVVPEADDLRALGQSIVNILIALGLRDAFGITKLGAWPAKQEQKPIDGVIWQRAAETFRELANTLRLAKNMPGVDPTRLEEPPAPTGLHFD